MKMILVLEDNAGRIAHFRTIPNSIIVTTAQEAIDLLPKQEWEYISLDHDLNGEAFVDSNRDDCGMEVVRWMAQNKGQVRTKAVIVHTANRRASALMGDTLRLAGYNVSCIPFGGEFDQRR